LDIDEVLLLLIGQLALGICLFFVRTGIGLLLNTNHSEGCLSKKPRDLAVQFIDCYHECRSSTFEEERLISFLRDRCNLQRLEHAAFLDDGHQLLHKLHHEVVLEKAIQLQ
jgi:hypothetical protein